MLNQNPNISRKDIFEEIPLPEKVKENVTLFIIYKAIFIAIKLLLDIRLNIVKLSEGNKINTKYLEQMQMKENNEKE